MEQNNGKIKHSASTHTRRVIAYIVLGFLTVMCLFWFYILLIYSTRSNSQIASGISFLPNTHFLDNFNNLVDSSQPIFKGLRNSLIIAAASAVLCTYFSTLTAYAIHVYDFKLKKFIFTFSPFFKSFGNSSISFSFLLSKTSKYPLSTQTFLVI